MYRHLSVAVFTAAAVAAFGFSGCSANHPRDSAETPSVALSSPSVAPPSPAALPAPDALIDVLNRLTDPNVPGANKVTLVEGSNGDSAATLDKFIAALRDNGYLPMNFVANNVAWSDKKPADVMASITVNTAAGNNRSFTFPMEFAPFQGGWQLSRRTAEMLLALGNSSGSTPPPASTPAPGAPESSAPAPTAPPTTR